MANNQTPDDQVRDDSSGVDPDASAGAGTGTDPDASAGAGSSGVDPIASVNTTPVNSDAVQEVKTEVVEAENSTAVQDAPLPAVQKAGYKLAQFILYIISGFLAFLLFLLATKNFDSSGQINLSTANVPDSIFQHQKDLIQALQEEKKNYRDFIHNISQMVLLNLLLPTLTAILGYIFGSREGRQTTNGNSTNN
jgi:hypothetical protein